MRTAVNVTAIVTVHLTQQGRGDGEALLLPGLPLLAQFSSSGQSSKAFSPQSEQPSCAGCRLAQGGTSGKEGTGKPSVCCMGSRAWLGFDIYNQPLPFSLCFPLSQGIFVVGQALPVVHWHGVLGASANRLLLPCNTKAASQGSSQRGRSSHLLRSSQGRSHQLVREAQSIDSPPWRHTPGVK